MRLRRRSPLPRRLACAGPAAPGWVRARALSAGSSKQGKASRAACAWNCVVASVWFWPAASAAPRTALSDRRRLAAIA